MNRALCLSVFVLATVAWAAPASAADGQATAAALVTPPDVQATLFAAEPLLSSPADIDVDARGRVWVCEVVNYRGKKETRPEGDRILVLEDTDGDGVADARTVFHQGRDVDSALGICVIGEGPGRRVIVSCAPDVFVFHDDDGDLRADRRESLFTNTGLPQHDHSVHAFVVGPDGRWTFNVGNMGKAVHDRDGRPVVDRFGRVVNDAGRPFRQGMVFRCRPDGGDFEVLGHNFRNSYEVAVDSFGDLWQTDNDDDGNRSVRLNYVMEHGNYGYVDERTGAGWKVPRTNLEAEIPQQHWHQNDPGVVPNLLHMGGGSPTGICVYEGALLPERFRGAVIHGDAGPNVVRASRLTPSGAGFTAEIDTLVDGSADRWFRPSDVCVAPDGSLIVADWYDPGVGGHGMGDTEKGRLYRLAPPGSTWSVPAVDLRTVPGAVAALASPNPCTRATALERLAEEPEAAAPALEEARATPLDDRHAARLAWALGMLPGRGPEVIPALLAADEPTSRIVGLRLCRRVQGDVIGAVEACVADPAAAVRREAAIALKGITGERADRAWAALAARHTGGDRWELEALGIGADGVWDGRLAAWRATAADVKDPAARAIVWRSRGAASAELQCRLIGEPEVTAGESLALIRSLDFQDQARVGAAVRDLLESGLANVPDEKRRVILPELVMRLEPAAAGEPAIATLVTEAADAARGTRQFIDIVRRFKLGSRWPDVVALAAAEGTGDQLAAAAAGALLDGGQTSLVTSAATRASPAAPRLLTAMGLHGSRKALALLEGLVVDAAATPDVKVAAVRALARSQSGAKALVRMATDGALTGPLPQVAAVAVASCPWADVRTAAAAVLPMPKAKEGALPPVAELVRKSGDADRGRLVFAGAGTCAKCHVVGSDGKAVGPNLSGIGGKLSRPALYEAILAPSAAISHNYETYTAVLDDGRSLTGLLVSQSPEEVVIRGADGIDVTTPAGEIEELVKQPVSLMPADLAATLSAEQLVDLVTWLETLKQSN